jgi:hypothetical protein
MNVEHGSQSRGCHDAGMESLGAFGSYFYPRTVLQGVSAEMSAGRSDSWDVYMQAWSSLMLLLGLHKTPQE